MCIRDRVFPDKAVKHGPPVQDVDADFAHDAFYHPAGGEVIGFVYVAPVSYTHMLRKALITAF